MHIHYNDTSRIFERLDGAVWNRLQFGQIDFCPVVYPTTPTITLVAEVGNVDAGEHFYYITFYTAGGETQLRIGNHGYSAGVTTDVGHGKVDVSLPISSDPRVLGRRIYRTPATNPLGNYYSNVRLVADVANNIDVTYRDNIADAATTNPSIGTTYYFQDNTTINYITINNVQGLRISQLNILFGYNISTSAYASSNTFIGNNSAKELTTGSMHVGIGNSCLNKLTSGTQNVGIGYNSLGSITTQSANVAVGGNSGSKSIGSYNTFVGYYTGQGHIGGDYNTYIGAHAGFAGNAGSSCVMIGFSAGYYETASNKLFIDNATRASEADGRAKALIYGIFDAAVANQKLYFNSNVYVAGSIYEAGRTEAMGEYVTLTSAALSCSGGTWTGMTINTLQYRRVKNSCLVQFALVGGTLAGNSNTLRITLPFNVNKAVTNHCVCEANATRYDGYVIAAAGSAVLNIYKENKYAPNQWLVAEDDTQLAYGEIEVEVQ